jgi:hypothetical protein
MNIWAKIAALSIATLFSGAIAAPNPNFHIYLAYGQSNMEVQVASKMVIKSS